MKNPTPPRTRLLRSLILPAALATTAACLLNVLAAERLGHSLDVPLRAHGEPYATA
jgi:hypothetical protein